MKTKTLSCKNDTNVFFFLKKNNIYIIYRAMRYEYGYRRMKSYIWCHRMGIFNVGGMGFGLKHLLTWDVALKAFPVASKQRITAMASCGPGGLNGKIICKWRDFPLPRLITGGHPIFWSLHCPCLASARPRSHPEWRQEIVECT
jgi:hypothetical protein